MPLLPSGKREFIDKLIMIKPFRLLWLSIASSIIFTQILVIPMSIFFHGKVTFDLFIAGIVCSFFVSMVISYLLIYLINHVHDSEQRYRRLFEVESDAILMVDCETGRILDANTAALNLYGYTREESLLLNVTDISAEPDETRQSIATHQTYIPFRRHRKKDGTPFSVEIAISYFDYQGHWVHVAAIRDITRRKMAEEALRKNELLLKEAQQVAHVGSWDWDTTTDLLWWSDEYFRLYGIDPALPKPNYWEHLNTYTSESAERLDAAVKKALQTGEPYELDLELSDPANPTRWISVRGEAKHDENGQIVGLRGTAQDITDRKKAENSLMELQRFSSNLLQNSAIAAFVLGSDHRVMLWNKACEELTGFKASDMIGTDNQWQPFYSDKESVAADIIIENSPEKLPALYMRYSKSALNPLGIKAEGWYNNLGGKDRYIVFEASPIFNTRGEIIAAIETLQDITESKRLEEQLLQSQKIEAIGELAGGVAHDFNNILSAIVGYASLSKMKMPADDPLKGNMEQILLASERAATITKSLLAFSRKQLINPRPVNVCEIVRKLEKFLTRLIREDIEIRIMCPEEEIIILADSTQIEQVLINLVTNARDAIPKSGRIVMQTETVLVDAKVIESHGYGMAGEYARIMVSDTGMGMDTKTIEKIFDPFFTTKEQGKGTGLGLSMAYGIVKQHNGYIDMYSEPGMGSIFKIYLPLHRGNHKDEQREGVVSQIRGGSETILIAEDDATLRKLVASILKDYGYSVIESVDGEDAVAKYSENRDQVKLVILDGIMPKKNGKEAYEEVCKITPLLKAIFMSGYEKNIISKEGLLEPGVNFLLKPVDPSTLLKKVREVLDAKG